MKRTTASHRRLSAFLALLILLGAVPSAQNSEGVCRDFGGRRVASPSDAAVLSRLDYHDSDNRLRCRETVYTRQYAELDGLSTQVVEFGLADGARVVTNTFSASAALSSGVRKTVTEFRKDKAVRREEIPPTAISLASGLAKKTKYYDADERLVMVENVVTTAHAQDKGYDRIVFFYDGASASREERRYVQSPANKKELTKLVIFKNPRGVMTADEQSFAPPFRHSNGAHLIVSHYGGNRNMTLQEHHYPEEFVNRMRFDLVKMYFGEQEVTTKVEYFRSGTLLKTEKK